MPARLRDLARVIEALGGTLEKPSSGSHWKAYTRDGRMYPLPSHNGPKGELGDEYLRGLARHFGVSMPELRRLLGRR
jgi:hypothetical protein